MTNTKHTKGLREQQNWVSPWRLRGFKALDLTRYVNGFRNAYIRCTPFQSLIEGFDKLAWMHASYLGWIWYRSGCYFLVMLHFSSIDLVFFLVINIVVRLGLFNGQTPFQLDKNCKNYEAWKYHVYSIGPSTSTYVTSNSKNVKPNHYFSDWSLSHTLRKMYIDKCELMKVNRDGSNSHILMQTINYKPILHSLEIIKSSNSSPTQIHHEIQI